MVPLSRLPQTQKVLVVLSLRFPNPLTVLSVPRFELNWVSEKKQNVNKVVCNRWAEGTTQNLLLDRAEGEITAVTSCFISFSSPPP